MKKLILIFCLMFFVTGCDVSYELKINADETFDEKATFSFLNQDMTVDDLSVYIKTNQPISNDRYEAKYYDSHIYTNGIYNDLVYDYVHDINSFRKSTFVDTCYPNMKITETDDEIRIESGKGFRCLNPDNGLITDHVDIAIVSELEVLENNADEVNDNTYSWTVNESNVQDKEVNLVLKRNKKNSMDINYFLIFGIIGVLIVILGIGLFLISKNRQNNDI